MIIRFFRQRRRTRNDAVRPETPEQQAIADAGDVPGWVMITLMTAALVVLLWAIAGPALTDLFNDAISRILSI
ncbi:MAG: hypothetical protein GX483_06515 [Actinomycetaceae bacterium]|nr:hypothetical protein [Actinomycetaceae bacterium]